MTVGVPAALHLGVAADQETCTVPDPASPQCPSAKLLAKSG
jgi:hypothetical protein